MNRNLDRIKLGKRNRVEICKDCKECSMEEQRVTQSIDENERRPVIPEEEEEKAFRNLPDDLLLFVFTNLSWQENFQDRLVCKKWNRLLVEVQLMILYRAPSCSTVVCSSQFIPSIHLDRDELFSRFTERCCGLEPVVRAFTGGEQMIFFPRDWLKVITSRLACPNLSYQLDDIKGGNMLLSCIERPVHAPEVTGSCVSFFSAENTRSTCLCHVDRSLMRRDTKREVVCVLNPVNSTFKIFHNRDIPQGDDHPQSGYFGLSTKRLLVEEPRNTVKILLVDSYLQCSMHHPCDIWSMSSYNVGLRSSSKFTFHNARSFRTNTYVETFPCMLYDATILGDDLFFITTLTDHFNTVHGIWKFSSASGSDLPTRLPDIANCTIIQPAIHVHQGRVMLLGKTENMADMLSCLWEYDVSNNTWILVTSFSNRVEPDGYNRDESIHWDLMLRFMKKNRRKYAAVTLGTRIISCSTTWWHDPQNIFLIES